MPSETYRIYDSTNEEWSNETYTLAELSLLPGIKLNSRIIPTQGGNVLTFEDACNSLKGNKVPTKPRAERSSTTPRGTKPEQASSIPDILLYDQLYTNALIRIVCIYLIFSILASLFISAFCGIAQIINILLQHELSVGLSLLILFGLLGLILAIIVMYCITQACKKRT